MFLVTSFNFTSVIKQRHITSLVLESLNNTTISKSHLTIRLKAVLEGLLHVGEHI